MKTKQFDTVPAGDPEPLQETLHYPWIVRDGPNPKTH